jgi:ubiquitin-conjugating enzyme E2 A
LTPLERICFTQFVFYRKAVFIAIFYKQMTSEPTPAILRLMTDLRQITNEPLDGASASPVNEDNLFVWNATIFGPENTPWEGGIFSLKLTFPEDYPSKPPKVKFTTEIFHPNVYGDGSLCLDIIQDKWSPIYTISTILLSIQSLLTDPNVNSPANPVAAQLYKTNPTEYNRRVRQCVERSQQNAC